MSARRGPPCRRRGGRGYRGRGEHARSTRSYTCPVDPRRRVRARVPRMPDSAPLRTLLPQFASSAEGAELLRSGGRAFVSSSLRPYVISALLEEGDRRPALVVAGDDRQARDLAADLRAWLAPRPGALLSEPRCDIRVTLGAAAAPRRPPRRRDGRAARARRSGEPPVVVVSAVALSEKVPDPELRPRSMTLRVGDLIDLDEVAGDLVAAGYERVDQVEDRGQFAMRGGILDVYPATEDRAIRVDLFDIEIESLRWFSTFTQRSLGDTDAVEIAPSAELAAEHREVAEIAALEDERPDIAELLPVDRFRAFLDLAADADVLIAAEEEVEPALRDHWQDVCAAFHDDDARHLYVHPDAVRAAHRRARALRAVGAVLRPARPAPRPGRGGDVALAEGGRVRAREAAALGLPHRDRLAAARRGRPRPLQPHPPEGRLDRRGDPRGPALRPGEPARRVHRRRAEARGHPRAPAVPPPARGAQRRPPAPRRAALVHRPADRRLRRPRGPRRRALRGLRDEDRRRRHARLPGARVPGHRQGLHAHRAAGEDQPLRGRGRRRADAVEARRLALGHAEGPRAPRRAGARRRAAQPLRRAQAPQRPRLRARRRLAARVRGRRSPTPRRPTSATRSTSSRRTWRRPGRWTASSAATSATARRRSRCARRSRRRPTVARSSCSSPRRSSPSSTRARSPSASRTTRSRSSRSAASAPPGSRRRRSPGSPRARSTSSSARTAC